MEQNKKVILVKGTDNEWYEQAIFIVKGVATMPSNLVDEAEKIINEYMEKDEIKLKLTDNAIVPKPLPQSTGKKKKQSLNEFLSVDKILNLSIMLSSLVLVLTIYNLFV